MMKSASKFFSPQTPRNAGSIPIHMGGVFDYCYRGNTEVIMQGHHSEYQKCALLLGKLILKYTSESDSPNWKFHLLYIRKECS